MTINTMKTVHLIDELREVFENRQPERTLRDDKTYQAALDMRWSWFLGGAEAVLEAMGKNTNLYITKAPARYEPKDAETTPVRPQPKYDMDKQKGTDGVYDK